MANDNASMPAGERIKLDSHYLRGTLKESLNDAVTGALHENDTHLSKFHGFYQQDNRDLREERRHQKLEPRYQFMLRLRLPGGALSPSQWLGLDDICEAYADGSLRLTTRQTFQFHEIFKHQLQPFIQAMDKLGLDSKGACGDVNRNVVTNINPYLSSVHQQLHQLSVDISERLCWRSKAYEEIWLEKDASRANDVEKSDEEEPFYTHRYLPRKFKVAIALPPRNDCDVLANDIGLIAIEEAGEIVGFNVAVGGGLGMTYGNAKTYPRLATPVGFVPAEDIVDACADIVAIQRDFGDRTDRAHARFKYTLDDHGLEWFKEQFQKYHGMPMQPLRDYVLEDSGDQFGWVEDDQALHHLTLFIPSGRIIDRDEAKIRAGVREIAQLLDERNPKGELRITCNQNLVIANVRPEDREAINQIVDQHRLDDGSHSSALYRNAISCVAFPTCGLAMAEAERYLPELAQKIEALMLETGMDKETIQLRVSGCPNGCARPYLGEIGLTGKALGKYNLFLGADSGGQRLNRLYRENISEEEILSSLKPLFQSFAQQRHPREGFGDFLYRTDVLPDQSAPEDFHQPLIAKSG